MHKFQINSLFYDIYERFLPNFSSKISDSFALEMGLGFQKKNNPQIRKIFRIDFFAENLFLSENCSKIFENLFFVGSTSNTLSMLVFFRS